MRGRGGGGCNNDGVMQCKNRELTGVKGVGD